MGREIWVWAAVLAALATLGAVRMDAVWGPAGGPVEPAWNRQACAHCGMLLGDPRFACELRRPDGETLFFDDPGCLLAYEQGHPGRYREFFHRLHGQGWVEGVSAAFVGVGRSPMGFGLGCVPVGSAGARPRIWAWERVRALADARADAGHRP